MAIRIVRGRERYAGEGSRGGTVRGRPASVAAFALSEAGFAYLCLAMICADCGARWFWLLASKRPGSPEHFDFRSDRCPICESRG